MSGLQQELDRVEAEPRIAALEAWQTWALAGALLTIGLATGGFCSRRRPTPSTIAIVTERPLGHKSIVQAEQPKTISTSSSIAMPKIPASARSERIRKGSRLYARNGSSTNTSRGGCAVDRLLPIEQMYLEAIGDVRLNPTRTMTKLQALVDL